MAAQAIALTPHQPRATDRCRRHPPLPPRTQALRAMGMPLPVHRSLAAGSQPGGTGHWLAVPVGSHWRSGAPVGMFWPGWVSPAPEASGKPSQSHTRSPRGTQKGPAAHPCLRCPSLPSFRSGGCRAAGKVMGPPQFISVSGAGSHPSRGHGEKLGITREGWARRGWGSAVGTSPARLNHPGKAAVMEGSSVPPPAPRSARELNPGAVCWLNQARLTRWKAIQAWGGGGG